jgi:hypothetical protein
MNISGYRLVKKVFLRHIVLLLPNGLNPFRKTAPPFSTSPLLTKPNPTKNTPEMLFIS